MGLIIPNYESKTGLIVENAYCFPVNIYYDGLLKNINFELAIYASKTAYLQNKIPLEKEIMGVLEVDYNGLQNLLSIIDDAVLTKISDVQNKTEEECATHNAQLQNIDSAAMWINRWDYEYSAFIGAYQDEI